MALMKCQQQQTHDICPHQVPVNLFVFLFFGNILYVRHDVCQHHCFGSLPKARWWSNSEWDVSKGWLTTFSVIQSQYFRERWKAFSPPPHQAGLKVNPLSWLLAHTKLKKNLFFFPQWQTFQPSGRCFFESEHVDEWSLISVAVGWLLMHL